MKKYDMLVIGSGAGMTVVDEAVAHGLKVALVDRGPVGGTCLNNGCIPSKMLIYAADRAMDAQEAGRLGIEAPVNRIDFDFIMERMRRSIQEMHDNIYQSLQRSRNPRFYDGEGYFTGDYSMEVNGEAIKADKIVIAAGSRPSIPPIKGLAEVDYLTNVTLLQLKERPESLIIMGGGYIGVEYGHFFAAMGTRVTIVEMADRLVLAEEPALASVLKKELSKRMDIYTETRVDEVKKNGGMVTAVLKDKTGKTTDITAQKLLVAVGRQSNADTLKVSNTGVEIDSRGFIKVSESLETSQKNIFAIGDVKGRYMFTHVANREARIAGDNILHEANTKMDYSAAPHAVYSRPQIAAVGMTEEEAREGREILVGIARYDDTAKGEAMADDVGFAKAIVDKNSMQILGFHIIGPYAPELIQEVIDAMASGGHINAISAGMHIHPALSELIQVTLSRLTEV